MEAVSFYGSSEYADAALDDLRQAGLPRDIDLSSEAPSLFQCSQHDVMEQAPFAAVS
jgi:hypothetical protein